MATPKLKTLVSLQDLKTYLGLGSDTSNDERLDMAAVQASLMVKRELTCDVIDQSYSVEKHRGCEGSLLYLKNWPLTAVYRVACGVDDVMTISYSGAGTHALIAVNPTNVLLRVAASGAWTVTELAKASYATITLMAAAINAQTGWTAVVTTGYGGWPSTDLVDKPGLACAGGRTVVLSVPEEGQYDYEIENTDWGVLTIQGLSSSEVYVDYRAGYTRASIPEDMKAAVLELASLVYHTGGKDPTLIQEKIGDYSYRVADTAGSVFGQMDMKMPSTIAVKLDPFRRSILWGG